VLAQAGVETRLIDGAAGGRVQQPQGDIIDAEVREVPNSDPRLER